MASVRRFDQQAMADSILETLPRVRLDKPSSVVPLERCTAEDSSSRRIMRLVPVFILETHNQTNRECLSKFVETDNASSSINTDNVS